MLSVDQNEPYFETPFSVANIFNHPPGHYWTTHLLDWEVNLEVEIDYDSGGMDTVRRRAKNGGRSTQATG